MYWKVCFECRLDSSRLGFIEVSDEGGRNISRHESEYGDKESVTWVKVELWILPWEVNSLEAWDAGSCLSKMRKMRFSLKETIFEGRLNIDFKENGVYFSLALFLKDWSLFLHSRSFNMISWWTF